MATPEEPHRRPLIPRLHWILSLFHPQLLVRRMTPAGLDKEGNAMGLDQGPNNGIRNAKETNVFKACTDPTAVRQTICSAYRCIGIWCGRHTLTRGRDQPPKTIKTLTPPYCLLLSNVYTD